MMNSAQKAVVSAAKKDGLSPMEIASELMNHDITEVVLGFMRKREVAFNKLSESEQDSVIAELGSELKKITATACRVINSNGVESVQASLKSLKIDGKLTATLVIDGEEPNRHVLTDKAHDKSSILIVLYPNSYSEGMSAHQGEKDQKSLPLDGEDDTKPKAGRKPRAASGAKSAGEIASKVAPIEIPAKMLEDARTFVVEQQNCSPAALQNLLKINITKAMRILELLAESGEVTFVGDDKSGQFELVRNKAAEASTPAEVGAIGGESESLVTPLAGTADPRIEDEKGAGLVTELSEELYERIKEKVIADNTVSAGALAVTFDCEDSVIEHAIESMELDGIISEESDLGTRTVLAQQ